MDGEGGCVAHAGDGAEGVGAGAEVSDFAEELQGVAFLLEGVGLRVGQAEDFQTGSFYLVLLAAAFRLDQITLDADAGAGVQGSDQGVVRARLFDDYLEVVEGRAVADLEEGNCAGGTLGLDPTLDQDVSTRGLALEQFLNAIARHGLPPADGFQVRILAFGERRGFQEVALTPPNLLQSGGGTRVTSLRRRWEPGVGPPGLQPEEGVPRYRLPAKPPHRHRRTRRW